MRLRISALSLIKLLTESDVRCQLPVAEAVVGEIVAERLVEADFDAEDVENRLSMVEEGAFGEREPSSSDERPTGR